MGNLYEDAERLKKSYKVDDEGQPFPSFNKKRRADRDIHELLGLCKGFLADKILQKEEVEFLERWFKTKQDCLDTWPANVIYERIQEVCADGVIDDYERKELFELLSDMVGTDSDSIEVEGATRLPFNNPLPPIIIEVNLFCFTGKFAHGSRKTCQEAVIDRGGLIANTVTHKIQYLVIGLIGSRDWAHTSHGRKIEHAVSLREGGSDLIIMPEQHWTSFL